jgi:hypothetical protein
VLGTVVVDGVLTVVENFSGNCLTIPATIASDIRQVFVILCVEKLLPRAMQSFNSTLTP